MRFTATHIYRTLLPCCLGLSLSLSILSGCQPKAASDRKETAAENASALLMPDMAEAAEKDETAEPPLTTSAAPVSQRLINPGGATLQERIQPPEGFRRNDAEEGSFAAFLRNFPMEPDGSPILLYDGRLKSRQDVDAAVFSLPVISSADLQQCADSVMRMYAEYFRQTGQYDKIRFHFVNGFLFDYPTYRAGGRVKFDGDTAKWQTSAAYDDSYEVFENYLYVAFAYSSTLSMKEESIPADLSDIRIGDVFLNAGSPGHVVMVVDVCERKTDGETGKKAFLLAQSYMPAQQFYVLQNPLHENDPWYYLDEVSFPFATPEYTFQEGSFRRLTYLG